MQELSGKMSKNDFKKIGERAVILLLIAIVAGWNFCFLHPKTALAASAESLNFESVVSRSHSSESDLCSGENFSSQTNENSASAGSSLPADSTPICCLSHGDDTPKTETTQKSDFDSLTFSASKISQPAILEPLDEFSLIKSADSPPPRKNILFSVFKKE